MQKADAADYLKNSAPLRLLKRNIFLSLPTALRNNYSAGADDVNIFILKTSLL
jgi:hypothetical protein